MTVIIAPPIIHVPQGNFYLKLETILWYKFKTITKGGEDEKRLLGALLCVSMIAAMLAGCGSKEKSADTKSKTSDANELVMGVSSSVTNLNKHLETMKEGWLMLGAVYDELYMKTDSEIRYYLADSVDVSEDGLTVTLKLKDNLKWHDGEAITADDVIFSMDVNADPDNGAGYANTVFIGEEKVSYEKWMT